MNLSIRPVLLALILAATACGGTDANKTGADVTDLTSAAYAQPPAASIEVSPAASKIDVGRSIRLASNVYDGSGNRVTGSLGARLAHWTSSDTTVAKVSRVGIVTGIRSGKAVITAVADQQTATSVVTVGTGQVAANGDSSSTPATTASAPVATPLGETPPPATPLGETPLAATPLAATPPSATPPAATPLAATPLAATPPAATPPPLVAPMLPTAPPAAVASGPVASAPQGVSPAPAPPTSTLTDTVSSNSNGSGLSGLAFVSDDFTRYAGTVDLMHNISVLAGGTAAIHAGLYDGGINTKLLELDNSVRYNGHPTLKYNQPGGTGSTPELPVYFPSTTHIWYRVKVRFSPGFTTRGTLANSANAYKLISWGWNAPINGSGRVEITNTTEYQLYENMQQGPSLVGGGAYLSAGHVSTEWTDGGWYDYIVEVDHSRPAGVIRLWRSKDGQAPVYQGEEAETMRDGSMPPPLTNIGVGLTFNQVRAVGKDQALWWGEWEVVDGNKHPNPFGLSR